MFAIRRRNAHSCRNRKESLFHAAKNGDEAEVKRLLADGKVDVDVRDRKGNTALILALKSFSDGTVAVLFKFRPNIHLKNNSVKSALQMALKLGLSRAKVIALFLNSLKEECEHDSGKLAFKLINMQCPLYLAAFLKDAVIIRKLISKGCAVDAKYPGNLQTSLHVAVALRDFDSIKVLIEYGADVNAMDLDGNIPVYYYRSFDDSREELDMLKTFVERTTSWTTLNRSGTMQVELVLRYAKKEALRMMLKSNIDWYATDSLGFSTLCQLVLNGELIANQEMLEELRNKKICDSARGCNGATALRFASWQSVTKLVELLLDSGVNPNLKDYTRSTPLYSAAEFQGSAEEAKENKKTFMLLLHRGADPQIDFDFEDTVYDNIIEYGNFHLAESALGQLAINESLGIPVIDSVRSAINSNTLLQDQFLLCKTQLEKLKQNKVRNSVSLFTLLSQSGKMLAAYARNAEFAEEWKRLIDSCSNSYYAYILRTNFENTMQLVKLRKDAGSLVCKIMGVSYESYPAIIDKIVNYVTP